MNDAKLKKLILALLIWHLSSHSVWGQDSVQKTLNRDADEIVQMIDLERISDVRKQLLNWAKDWSRGDAEAVIGYYHNDFPQRFSTGGKDYHTASARQKWLRQRRARIDPNRQINVDVLILDMVLSQPNNRVKVVFEQNYSSNSYHDKVIKTMLWEPSNGIWLIRHEEVLKRIDEK